MIFGEGLVFFSILLFGLWKIRSAIKKELQLSQRQNNFLLSVTHELKTPLAANKLYLQTIQKRNLDEDKRNSLMTKAIQENERLEDMIENILNASRLENNALKPHKIETNVTLLFHQLAERFQKRNQLEIIHQKIDPSIIADIDTFFIETIVNNLLENALKYGGNAKDIELYLTKNGFNIIFGVKDNGPGIPKADIANVFSKFYRAGNEDTRQQKGSGLGLFIVAELVRIHKGKVVYKENKPSGANIEITL
jgi:K+-sensing histidine kinase KdpD